MENLQYIKEVFYKVAPYRYEILAGLCLATAIALFTVALLHIHFTQVHVHWAQFSPRVLQPLDLPRTILLYGSLAGSGIFMGGTLFLLKCAVAHRIEKKVEERLQKSSHTVRRILRETHFLYCLTLLLAIVAGGILVTYGAQYASTMQKVFELGLHKQFYSIGYLANGHGIELAFASITVGSLLITAGLLEFIRKAKKVNHGNPS